MADVVAITKADGENKNKANEARSEYQHALHLSVRMYPVGRQVLTCSALLQRNGCYLEYDC